MTAMKTVIVSGGTFGLGQSITVALAQRGYHVVAFGLMQPQVSSTAQGAEALRAELAQHGCRADILEADVSNAQDVQRVVDHALSRQGAIHGLVNNAAIGPLGTVLDTDEALFERILDVNLKGTFLVGQSVARLMARFGRGAIVNMSSVNGVLAIPTMAGRAVANLRQRMWELRDRNLAYVLPFILTMLGFLTLWVAHLIMRPIRLLESTLSSVTSTNLGDSSNLEAPYVEFERIVSAFQDLRVRLRDSFAKARRFAADASHELRTPLTILRGNVEQLINQLPVGADSQVQMRMIGDEVERLIDITEKLLLLSRADGNSMVKEDSDFAISEFLEELVSDAHTFHPELVTRGEIEPHKVWSCDQRLIQQLIYNLYSNAVKYNVPQGWIHIRLQPEHDQWVLSFENPCEDIPVDLPKLAFDRFYRGNAAHSRKIDGLGLGLSLCQEIARLHGVQLTLSSPNGSTVLLRLVIPGKSSLHE